MLNWKYVTSLRIALPTFNQVRSKILMNNSTDVSRDSLLVLIKNITLHILY